jgi:hypothetical protein
MTTSGMVRARFRMFQFMRVSFLLAVKACDLLRPGAAGSHRTAIPPAGDVAPPGWAAWDPCCPYRRSISRAVADCGARYSPCRR